MRISTNQIYRQNISSLTAKQNATAELVTQLSVGKKVITAGDDPVASASIDNLRQQNVLLEQYVRNIDFAKHRLATSESKFNTLENVTTGIRSRFITAMNGGITENGRQQIITEMEQDLELLVNIANSQDEMGNYIFAGFKTGTPPFVFDANNIMNYNGDSGTRFATVAYSSELNVNLPGDDAFMLAKNAMGDFRVNYDPTQQGNFEVQSAKVVNNGAFVSDDYSFSFVTNFAGNVGVNIFNSQGNFVHGVNQFDASIPISFNGIEVQFSGQPSSGDFIGITPKEHVNIFDVVQTMIDFIETNQMHSPAGTAEYIQLLDNFDSGNELLRMSRTKLASNLKSIDSYTMQHQEEKLVNATALSMLEDLDFSVAITELEKEKFALNAISSVIGKVGTISLFDYL